MEKNLLAETSNLVERAERESTPLIVGSRAVFLWKGEDPPYLMGDFTGWEHGEPARLNKVYDGIYLADFDFPQDAYMEYSFIRDGERIPDPLNNRTLDNGFGKLNHYFFMPESTPTDLANERENIHHGLVTRYSLATDGMAVGKRRLVHLYHPPVREPVPLLVVYDGLDYLRRARLSVIVDNLISNGRIQPLAMAFVHQGGQARFVEYSCSEATLSFIAKKVLPLAREKLNLVDIDIHPGAYGVLGASMGGLMALFTGLRLPHIFGRVLSQSGSFTTWNQDLVVYDLVRSVGEMRPRVWMDVGRYEWLMDTNQRMHALMVEMGIPVTYREFNAGHNFTAWRDDVWRGLECLFGTQAGRK
jgi:enterochelin esterase-like enzyme